MKHHILINVSGCFPEFNNGQFPVIIHEGYDQLQLATTFAFDWDHRVGTRGFSGPAFPRLVPGHLTRWTVVFVEFQRCGSLQGLMGTERIVPLDEHGHLRAHVIAGIRDGDFAKIDVFESADKPFNHCNASMFAYRSKTRFSA